MATIFCNVGTIPSTAVMCCCSSERSGSGVDGPATAADVVLLLIADVPLAGWGWEGGGVCDWDSGEGPGSARFDSAGRL